MANEIRLEHWVLASTLSSRNFYGDFWLLLDLYVSSSFESSWQSNLGEWSNAQYKCEPSVMTKRFDSKHFNVKVIIGKRRNHRSTWTKEEVKCDNCQRQVPSENYQMHVVHCKRNIQLCSLCGEIMLRSEEKEHFKQYHAEINCIQCGQKTTRNDEGNHPSKRVRQETDSLPILWNNLAERKNARVSEILWIQNGM